MSYDNEQFCPSRHNWSDPVTAPDAAAVDVAALRGLLDAATPGRWVAFGTSIGAESDGCTCHGGIEPYGHEQYCGIAGPVVHAVEADVALIAAAVNALPALLALAEQHAALVEAVRGLAATFKAEAEPYVYGGRSYEKASDTLLARADCRWQDAERLDRVLSAATEGGDR